MRVPLLVVALLSFYSTVDAGEESRLYVGDFSAYDRRDSLPIRRNNRRLKKTKETGVERRYTGQGKRDRAKSQPSDVKTPAPTPHPTLVSSVTVESGPSGDSRPSPVKGSPPASYPSDDRLPSRKYRSGKKHKRDKLKKGDKGGGKKSSNRSRPGKGKGKGRGNGDDGGDKGGGGKPPTMPDCSLGVSDGLVEVIPEVISYFPKRCCNFQGPVAVYVTHAQFSSDRAESGFDSFWELVLLQIELTSKQDNVCYTMTGYDPEASSRSLADILTDTIVLASSFPDVIAMMVTDPTDSMELLNEVRFISNDRSLPSIGVFNAGYSNVVVESLVSGQERLPFIGFLSDADFGTEAAKFTLNLLNGVPAKPLCFNGRPDLSFVGERCAAYYTELTSDQVDPGFGISCSVNSKVEDILNLLVTAQANAVFSHVDCCATVARAAAMAKAMGQSILAVGCQDEDTSNGLIDFVTTQPLLLQGYSPATWANFPVQQSMAGNDGREQQYFPSLTSVVNTAIFTVSA